MLFRSAHQTDVEDVIARLHTTIRNPVDIDDKSFGVTASIGSVVYPRDVTQKHMIIELADREGGTLYTATVKHADEKGCQTHAAMGFEQGWGVALDQMVAMIQSAPS